MIDQLNAVAKRFQNLIEYGDFDLVGKVQYDNAPFIQPDDLWIRWSIQIGESIQLERDFATGSEMTSGQAVASIFFPWEKGLKLANEIANEIRLKFHRISIDGVTYRTPSYLNLGKTDEFWQINEVCPFFYDEVVQ